MNHDPNTKPQHITVDTVKKLLEALLTARPGDTIELQPGVYELDSPVVIGESVRLSCTRPEA